MSVQHECRHIDAAALHAIYARHVMAFKKPCASVRDTCRNSARPLPSKPDLSVAPQFDPSYLFHCGVEWHRNGDTSAGWSLVQAMKFGDRGARALAAELLAQTEDGRLLVRDLRRTRSGLRDIDISANGELAFREEKKREDLGMNTPYGLQMVENCQSCKLKKNGWYCELSQEATRSFCEFSHLTSYPGGAILFVEGQTSRGTFILCSGKVKLSSTSKDGKVLVLKMADPGEVIGLSAMISGDAYQVTAETVGPCLVNFIEREGLIRLMERSGELGLRSALAVSREFQAASREMHDLILARSSSGKLARLLLSWVSRDVTTNQDLKIHAPVTHEEMAQRIGASRETVTRLLSNLRKKNLIKLEGTTLIIRDRTALEEMAV
jgi:CRP/FNR family transcriptional regulator, cyclic AMP receptor protein